MVFIILSSTLFLAYTILMMAYKAGWRRQRPMSAGGSPTPVSVSVIIPARNEEANIRECLEAILRNGYPAALLEIIVVDDFSTDRTAALAEDLLANGQGRVLRMEQYLSAGERLNAYKKKALETAIGVARGSWIITTDADCIVPPGWLRELSAVMAQPDVRFIAAPVSFTPAQRRKDTCYYFQSLDFMTMQGITAAAIPMQLGNMCNGANLAFSKEAFHEVEGYKGIDHIASGDDMMLMYKIRERYPEGIRYLKSEKAIVQTPAQPGWRSFLNQRIRWSSKADQYDDKKLTLILVFVYLFNLHLPLLLVAGFFHAFYWLWLSGMLFAKVIVELLFLAPVAAFYRKKKELLVFPLLQPLHILYIITAGFLGKFGSYRWKGRKVK